MSIPDGKNNVVWDVSEGGRGPVIRDGVVYVDRRGLFARIGAAFVAAAAFLIARPSTAQPLRAPADSPQYDETRHTDIGHGDTTANHTDLPGPPHADGQPHFDHPHIDENTFSDTSTPTPVPHGDG